MQKTAIIIIAMSLWGCGSNKKTGNTISENTLPDTAAQAQNPKMDFSNPERIDTSDYVMYKLILNITGYEVESEYSGSSRSYKTNYWNIIFYNTSTGKYHLLDEKRKMLIDVSNGTDGDASTTSTTTKANSKADTLLYYSVTACDYNHDGKLDESDPSYLFTSNKMGYYFKQISPDSLKVTSWQLIKSSNKILMQIVKDTNKDRKFTSEDEVIPYSYDIKTGVAAKEVFLPEFKTSIRHLEAQRWPQPKTHN
ncbi:hypothetical protein [Mucilaginibacter paludis]|uniref:Uncharacterized protein n=1 Tax=Mucilaginibacter paludis DSM 18603 TaxID=714943 RepID=H1YDH0_9SPHI|nr:hypothetical protein [Mucilaginibacter paludis]EHQ30179.1 hypothetical protein Mucpa_6121 [Mucilaginibacter paludis DSM 18603]